jgi:biopolymer transport protein ExbB
MDPRTAEFLEQAKSFLEQGGTVMIPLVISAAVVWFALGYRLFVVRRGRMASLPRLVELYRTGAGGRPRGILDAAVARGVALRASGPRRTLRGRLEDAFAPLVERLGAYGVLARAVVLVAPLMGLLGTVTGMIEMFDSLGDQTFFSQTGGIARGIAEALYTTEMGLGVAIPAFIVGRLLDRKQERIQVELERLKDLLCGPAAPEVNP